MSIKTMYRIDYLYHSASLKKPNPVKKHMGWFTEFDAQRHFLTLSNNPKVSDVTITRRVISYEIVTKQFSSSYIQMIEECLPDYE